MPPFDIPSARGRGNPHPRRRRRPIPTKLYTPLTGAGRRSTPRRVVTRNHRAVVTRQPYKPNPKKVISHGTVRRLQQRAKLRQRAKAKAATPGVLSIRFAHAKGSKNAHNAARVTPGVQLVADAEYRDYNRRLWNRAKSAYPGGHVPPSLILRANKYTRDEYRGTVPYKRPGRPRRVLYTPDVALSSLLRDDMAPFADYVPLHEWAHVYQRRPHSRRGWEANEGAADQLALQVAKDIGVEGIPNYEYKPYRRRARRRGQNYIHRGQFR